MNRDFRYAEVRDIVYYPTRYSDEDKYSLDLFIPIQKELCEECVTSDVKKTTSSLYPCESSSDSCQHGHCQTRESQSPNTPVVLFVHGGGWQRGGRLAWVNFMRTPNLLLALITWCMNLYRNVGAALASRGVACAVISYPLVELPMPWTLLDILVSYCCSLLVSGPVCLLFCVLVVRPVYSLVASCPQSLKYPNITAMLTFNNIVVSLAISFSSRRRVSIQYKTCFPAILLVMIVLILELKDYLSFILFLGTFIIYLTLFTIYRKREPISHKQQIEAVTRAILWIKHFGEESSYYDPTALFLMGHSAGGHLIALLALEKQYIKDAGCSPTDIKGVMCISGVYDLLTLASPLSRRLYLQPTFGHHSTCWESASPVRTLNRADDTLYSPSFLIINAQFDGFFKAEGDNFYNQLRKKKFEVVKKSVKRTTHFTIMSRFSTAANSEISSICVDFVKDIFRQTSEIHQNTAIQDQLAPSIKQ